MSSRTPLVRALQTAVPRRGLHSTSVVSFPPRASGTLKKAKNVDPMDVLETEEFQFDDTTSLGHLRLMKIEEAKLLIDKVKSDRANLRGEFQWLWSIIN